MEAFRKSTPAAVGRERGKGPSGGSEARKVVVAVMSMGAGGDKVLRAGFDDRQRKGN